MKKLQEVPGFGIAQKEKLTELLDEIRGFHFSVSIDDIDSQYVFALVVRDLVTKLQTLAAPILPTTTRFQLKSIAVDAQDFLSATSARAKLDALVPAVEDALQAIDCRPGTLLPGPLRKLLKERDLDPVNKEVNRALARVYRVGQKDKDKFFFCRDIGQPSRMTYGAASEVRSSGFVGLGFRTSCAVRPSSARASS